MIEPEAVALILLAAGRSTRFGVADKLAAPLHGRPLVQHAANTLSPIPFGRHIAVCSSSLPVDFAALGFDVAWLRPGERSEEHTSELQSLMRISYAVFCLKKKNHQKNNTIYLVSKPHQHH